MLAVLPVPSCHPARLPRNLNASTSLVHLFHTQDMSKAVVYSDHTHPVKSAKFAPTGKYVASGGEYEICLRLLMRWRPWRQVRGLLVTVCRTCRETAREARQLTDVCRFTWLCRC